MLRERTTLFRALTALLFLSSAACGGRAAPAAAGAADDPVAMPQLAVAEGREVADTLILDATLAADEDSQVTPIVPGRVVEVLVERGAHVETGDPLVRLRDVDYRLQARTARASVEAAAARLGIDPEAAAPAPEATPEVRSAAAEMAAADEALRRAEELAGRGVYSVQQLDEARSRALRAREAHAAAINAIRASIAGLESARSALGTATTALRESTVTAPFAGEIAERSVSVGEYVSLATPLVTLVRTDPLRAEVIVPQALLSHVRSGLAVRIAVDAFPGRSFEGTIRYVSASVRRESRGLVVEALVPNGAGELRPGMFGRVTIDLGTRRTVVAVPENAVLTEAGVSRAFVVAGGAVEERIIELRAREAGTVLLEAGVRPGESVAIERLESLADGMVLAPAAPPVAGAPGGAAAGEGG